jgi:hypothetical protein
MTCYAEVIRNNVNHFGAETNRLDITAAKAYLSDQITGRLGANVGAHTLDAYGFMAVADRDRLFTDTFGPGFAHLDPDPTNPGGPALPPDAAHNNKGWVIEHTVYVLSPQDHQRFGLGTDYRPTPTDQEVMSACVFFQVLCAEQAFDAGELPLIGPLLKPWWTAAGLPWNPAWDGAQAPVVAQPAPSPAPAPGAPAPTVGGSASLPLELIVQPDLGAATKAAQYHFQQTWPALRAAILAVHGVAAPSIRNAVYQAFAPALVAAAEVGLIDPDGNIVVSQ